MDRDRWRSSSTGNGKEFAGDGGRWTGWFVKTIRSNTSLQMMAADIDEIWPNQDKQLHKINLKK